MRTAIIISLLALTILLAGCDVEEKLLGCWVQRDNPGDGTLEIENGQIITRTPSGDVQDTFGYMLKGKKLSIINNGETAEEVNIKFDGKDTVAFNYDDGTRVTLRRCET